MTILLLALALALIAVLGLAIMRRPRPTLTFGDAPSLVMDSPQHADKFEVDVEKRTIRGMAVPYGVAARSKGKLYQFAKGTLKFTDPRRVKLWVQHDKTQAIGVGTKFEDTDAGLMVEFAIARGPEGDRALSLAEDGVLDGLSIGLADVPKFQLRGDVHHVTSVPLMEVSLTPAPAFDDARVHSVAADATSGPDDGAFDFAAFGTQLTTGVRKAIFQGFGDMQLPQRESVAAGDRGGFEVAEPSPYRFDGIPAEHSFVADLRDSASGDGEAKQRLAEFTDELASFAVTVANASALNPAKNRPDLYVPNLQFSRPLWELVSNGTVEDVTPFTVPKFSSASGLVGAHTAGVEPTPGAFEASLQTITPAPKSGKVEILREVWDQGGNPKADAIIWAEMLNGWYEAVEADIATTLAGTPTAELNLGSAVDGALVAALTGYFAGLQFVRGGNRFTAFAADGTLFPALVGAKDSAGRPLLPVVGPQNAQGTTGGGFDRVQLGNQDIRAAWALGSGNAAKSYNFVPTSVWAWASTPKRFTFEYQVKSVDMAIWGYAASARTRDSDVKPIDYTVADA